MKTAIITASTKGIGKSIALKLLSKDCFVIINYSKNDVIANELNVELMKDYPNQYKIVKADLSSYDGMEIFVDECLTNVNMIDYLVLNTGITAREKFEDLSLETWKKVMDTNLNIPFFTVQKLSKNIYEKGSIVFIGSILGEIPHSVSIPYGVSKAGLHFLAKSLVKEFAKQKVTVNAICPGFVDTTWQLCKSPEIRKQIEEKTALGRFAKPEEIAELCYSILTNNFINGSIINIDGGYSYR